MPENSQPLTATQRSVMFLTEFLQFLKDNTEDGFRLPPSQIVQQYIRSGFINPDGTWDIEEFNWRYNILEYVFQHHTQYDAHSAHFHTSFFDWLFCWTTVFNEVAEAITKTVGDLKIHAQSAKKSA